MDHESDEKPEWWMENEQLRREMDLGEYEPPRFEDDTYTHEVASELEDRYDCDIMFQSNLNPEYPEAWDICVDLRVAARIGRHRDENGNTVYEMAGDRFREIVTEYLET